MSQAAGTREEAEWLSAATHVLALLRSGWRSLVVRESGQLAALDGLRALAVLLVIGDHFSVIVWGGTHLGGWWLRTPFFRYGWSGVDLFFVLSGFLIGGQLWRERKRSGTVNLPRFFLRRGLRIWPLYFALLAVMRFGGTSIKPEWPDWALVSNYFPTLYARSWSLSTEEMFYLLVPLFVVCVPRLKARTIALILVATLVVVDTSRVLTFHHMMAAAIPSQEIALRLYSPFHSHNEGLIIGLLLALLVAHAPQLVAPSLGRRPSRRGLAVLGAALGLAGLDRFLGGQALSFSSLALAYGGATYFVLVDRSALSAVFRWRIWFPVARLSYGMYLNHLILGTGFILAALAAMQAWHLGAGTTFALGLGLTTAISLMFAGVTFVLVEHPFLHLRNRILAHAPAAPVAVQATRTVTMQQG
ncbi:MAG TPA: acyltransferase [Gemmatimonadales bacterium]|nr:acyltransferase [Gemmatimonadales bacterium]